MIEYMFTKLDTARDNLKSIFNKIIEKTIQGGADDEDENLPRYWAKKSLSKKVKKKEQLRKNIELTPSDEQKIIIDAINFDKNILVDAVAGSGKTTTLIFIAKAYPQKKILQIKIHFISFHFLFVYNLIHSG
jgi:superfamily II DNA or RNA helicase